MTIVVADTGLIWNPNNPYLEKYNDDVVCVYLEGFGKKSDKYESFTSNWMEDCRGMRGMADNQSLVHCRMYDELHRRSDELVEILEERDQDILFLTDFVPSTLYPYHALKGKLKSFDLHLVTMAPWNIMGKRQCRRHRELLRDLDSLKSLLYINADKELPFELLKTVDIAFKTAEEYMGAQLRIVANEIDSMDEGKYYYDFYSDGYISADEGYGNVISAKQSGWLHSQIKETMMVGMIAPPRYGPLIDKEEIEALTPRIDGKQICEELRKKRIELAALNGIRFESEECPSEGACAGTCPKCDEEAERLRIELKKIPRHERRYPSIVITEGEIQCKAE